MTQITHGIHSEPDGAYCLDVPVYVTRLLSIT